MIPKHFPEAPMSIEKLDELLDDDTEICIDNLCWDYQGYMNDPHEETDDALDKSRSALRSRIRELIEEARKEGRAEPRTNVVPGRLPEETWEY